MAERRVGVAKWGALEDESDSEEVVEAVAAVPARGKPAAARGKEKASKAGAGSLPATTETVNAQGIKTVVSYTVNAEGQRVKITRKIKSVSNRKLVPDRVLARRQWAPFGEAERDVPGEPSTTTFVGDEIMVVPYRRQAADEKPAAVADNSMVGTFQTTGIVCRTCGKDHWTSKCPFRGQVSPDDMPPTGDDEHDGRDGHSAPSGRSEGSSDKYTPPRMRGRMGGEGGFQRHDDSTTVRVTNLSQEVREMDLNELFRPFGPILRIHLRRDRVTGHAVGFAFVTFVRREDAAKAIDTLDGYGYDHLILHVEWAAPKPVPGGAPGQQTV